VTVPLFRRRRDEDDDEVTSDEETTESLEDVPAVYVNVDEPEPDTDPPFSRENGPWDASEAPEATRLDLGSLQVPGYPGLEMRIEVDEETGNVVSVAAVVNDAAVQIQVFAAPRSQGVWREVRGELAEGIIAAGGTAEEVVGPFGQELRTRIPVESPEGNVVQEARFVGVDGPRWFLRGVFSGTAYEPLAMPDLEDVLRGCVVVRGDVPMAPKDPLALHLPTDITPTEEPEGRPPLEPFRRGPEITEIH
jgi:hypothetical protein